MFNCTCICMGFEQVLFQEMKYRTKWRRTKQVKHDVIIVLLKCISDLRAFK